MRWFVTTAALSVLWASGAALAQEVPVDLAAHGRPSDEVERDKTSMPIEVFSWVGVEPGDAVADIHAGQGYNSWILSQWVGPEGKVYAQGSYHPERLIERSESGDLHAAGNVTYVATIPELPANTFDLVFTDRNYHDIKPEQLEGWLATIASSLKPGGLFVVIDVEAAEGRDLDSHRIASDVIIAEVTAAGFELVDQSDMLGNPNDDHVGPGWDHRDALDRCLLKFRKPSQETG